MTDDNELDISFTIDPSSVSLSSVRDYEVGDIDGPVVRVGDATYRSTAFQDFEAQELENALNQLSKDDEFQSIVENCPTNTPREYKDIDYLTRHLPTQSLRKCRELSEDTPFDKELILLVAYVERQNSLVGRSDNVLEYYLEQRDELADEVRSSTEVNSEIERSFFSYLLLASALMEELTTETVLNELYREEARIHSVTEHVRDMGHGERLGILCDIQILSHGDHSKMSELKDRRNNLVHDVRKRAGLDEVGSREEVARTLEKTDEAVAVMLSISGKDIESTVAEHGCDPYIEFAQSEAVENTITTWENEREEDLEALRGCERADLEQIRWDVEESTSEKPHITDGFEFDGFDDEEVYETLMEFTNQADEAFLDRIDEDANESNLDRFDFALMLLLCAGHSYDEIARWLHTEAKYVQRKENVVAWRASEFEKELVDEIPEPDGPVW